MANRRDEVIAALHNHGLSDEEVDLELSFREAEAERILEEADESDRAAAVKEARAHLFSTEVFYVVHRSAPARPIVKAPVPEAAPPVVAPARAAMIPIKAAAQPPAPVAKPPVARVESTAAPVVASTPPLAVKPPVSKRESAPQSPVVAAQPIVPATPPPTPVAGPVAVVVPPPVVASTPVAETSAAAPEVETKPEPVVVAETPKAVVVEAPSPTPVAVETPAAQVEPIATPAPEPAEPAAVEALPAVEAAPVVAEVVVETTAEAVAEPAAPALEAVAATVDTPIAEAAPPEFVAEAPAVEEKTAAVELPSAGAEPQPEADKGKKKNEPRLTRKQRRELAGISGAGAPAPKSEKQGGGLPVIGGVSRSLGRYRRWGGGGSKLRRVAALVAPVAAIAAIAAIVVGLALSTASDSQASRGASASVGTAKALQPSPAFAAYTAIMQSSVNAFAVDLDTMSKLAVVPGAGTTRAWAEQMGGAALDIKAQAGRLRTVPVPICIGSSHQRLMVGVASMENAANNVLAAISGENPDGFNVASAYLTAATPAINQAVGEIKATTC